MLKEDPESAPLSEISARKLDGLGPLKILVNSPKTNTNLILIFPFINI